MKTLTKPVERRHPEAQRAKGKRKLPAVTPHRSYSSYELFGTDSEEEEEDQRRAQRHGIDRSFFTYKCFHAYCRIERRSISGEYYVTLKTYKVDDITQSTKKKLLQADMIIRNRTGCDTNAWFYLNKYLDVTRRQLQYGFIFNNMVDEHRLIEASNPTEQPHKSRKLNTPSARTPPPPPPPSPRPSTPPTTSKALKKRGQRIEPHASTSTAHQKTSARDMFGSDSDDECAVIPGKKGVELCSYYSKRVANGVARQMNTQKQGSHFIELKVYNCEEIKNIQPMNRWRHAVITIKNRTNDDTVAWGYLTDFIRATRKEFKDCRPDLLNGC